MLLKIDAASTNLARWNAAYAALNSPCVIDCNESVATGRTLLGSFRSVFLLSGISMGGSEGAAGR